MSKKTDLIKKIANELEKMVGFRVKSEVGVTDEIRKKVDEVIESFKDELKKNMIICYVKDGYVEEAVDYKYNDLAFDYTLLNFYGMNDYVDENNYEEGEEIAEIFVNTKGEFVKAEDGYEYECFIDEEVTGIELCFTDDALND